MSTQHLDHSCAEYGYRMAAEVYKEIGKNAENHITKSLGVLQENGVYAFFLYQVKKPGAERLKELAAELLRHEGFGPFHEVTDPLEAVRGSQGKKGLVHRLDDLLLAKRLLEQALIYARYHVKALEG